MSSTSGSSSSESGSDSDDEGAVQKNAKTGNAEDPKSAVMELSGSKSDSDSDASSETEQKVKKKKKKAKKAKKKDKKKERKAKNNKSKDKAKGKKAKKKDKKAKGKKDKKDKAKKRKLDAVSNQFGKYGVIKAEDFFAKKPEFLLWAMEVKKTDTDAMGQMQLKELFKDFIEDYNTATMPSKKYYNLAAYDQQNALKRSRKQRGDDMTEAQRASLASFDDERARREEIRQQQLKKQEMQVTEEVRKMRGNKQKVDEMRHQSQLRTQMDMLHKTGHSKEAEKIAARLNPGLDEFGRPLTARTMAQQSSSN